MPSPLPPPAGLKAKQAETLWREVTGTYELRADELRILEDACREVDLVERLEVELSKAELVVKGSMGQPVANPLVQEIRQHRQVVKGLLAALKLPDEDGSVSGSRSSQARAAAQARWRRTA